jgi:superfamily II DNA or RNA helicase
MNDLPYTLTPYQEYAIREIKNRFIKNINPVCALPTGEGKTIIACAIIKTLIDEGKAGFLIIARANNLHDPWINELQKFSIPYNLIHGLDRKDKRINNKYPFKKGGVLLTSHHTSALDMDFLENTGQFFLLIIDEIHINNNSKRLTNITKQFSRLNAKRKLFLTATPIQNNKNELGLLNILLNYSKVINHMEPNDTIEKKELDSYYQDAVKNRILILQNMHAQMTVSSAQRDIKVSNAVLAVPLTIEMEDYIADNLDYFMFKSKTGDLSPRKKLFQFLSHPDSIYKNNMDIKKTLKCGKIEAVLSILDNIPSNDKIIIFSQYKDVLYRYFNMLNEKSYQTVMVTGEDRGVDINKKLRLFKETTIYRVLLTTLFKSAEGLNLKEANHVIILEFWWNPQKIIQAMGRVIRKNQKKDVFIYLLCYNKDGAIYKHEAVFMKIMENKITEAKETIPTQAELPDIRIFRSLDTYQDELKHFLNTFLHLERIGNTVSSSTTDKNKKTQRVKNSNKDVERQTIEKLLNELLCIQSQDIFPNYDKQFDDLDLTGPSNEKPHFSIDFQDNSRNYDKQFDDLDLTGPSDEKPR